MYIRVLGSAAGGGFPQWNCGCPNCRGVRNESVLAIPRTQASVAVGVASPSGTSEWFVLSASPEIRAQIESFPPLHPRAERDSPIAGILLPNGDLDACLGLLSLRESQRLHVYATDAVRRGFTEDNVLYRTLERFDGQITWHVLEPGAAIPLSTQGGEPSGLTVEALAVPGKVPRHLDGRTPPSEGDNIALVVRLSGRSMLYAPSVAAVTPALERALDGVDCVFFDGTFWTSDELVRLGLGGARAEDMAHCPLSGRSGSLETLSRARAKRRILIHINNTNPILREGSAERQSVTSAGVEVAYDGMELEL